MLLILALVSIAAIRGYRLEIGAIGLKFEENYPASH